MTEIIPGTTDAAVEKHVPVWTVARSIRISYSRLYRHLGWMIVWMRCPISSQAVNSSE